MGDREKNREKQQQQRAAGFVSRKRVNKQHGGREHLQIFVSPDLSGRFLLAGLVLRSRTKRRPTCTGLAVSWLVAALHERGRVWRALSQRTPPVTRKQSADVIPKGVLASLVEVAAAKGAVFVNPWWGRSRSREARTAQALPCLALPFFFLRSHPRRDW